MAEIIDLKDVKPEPVGVGAMVWRPVAAGTYALNIGDGALIKCTHSRRDSASVAVTFVPGLRVVERRWMVTANEMVSAGDGVESRAVEKPLVGYALVPASAVGDGWVVTKSITDDPMLAWAHMTVG